MFLSRSHASQAVSIITKLCREAEIQRQETVHPRGPGESTAGQSQPQLKASLSLLHPAHVPNKMHQNQKL